MYIAMAQLTYMQSASHNRADLVSSAIHPGLEEAHEVLAEVFDEMEGQLNKEIERIRELMRVRQDDPGELHSAPVPDKPRWCTA